MTEPIDLAAAGSPRRGAARRTVLLAAWGLLLTAVLAAGALRSSTKEGGAAGGGAATTPAAGTMAQARIARGKYLVTILACNDCHTPLKMGANGPEPDMSRMLSGHPEAMVMPPAPQLAPEAPWNWSGAATLTAFAGPWGVSYAANLTPDQNTGLGVWSEEMFVHALRSGKHMGQARELLPPMPWQWLGQMTDEDLAAVFAYLRSIPPIHNRVPDAVIAPPPPAAGKP